MVIIGADLHKRTHTAVAIDETGRKLGQRTVDATPDGHRELLDWARLLGDHRWALEDCRNLSHRLEADLVRTGESVVRVPPKLMAGSRTGVREPGKSDPIDALAVARAALREPNLPVAHLDGPERDLRLLIDHREDLVATRTRMINRLRWHLHELGLAEPAPRSIGRKVTLDGLGLALAGRAGTVAQVARELVEAVAGLTVSINRLEREIEVLTVKLGPNLLELPGCGILSAAKLIGETAGIDRFKSRAAFARYNGTAPVPVWSGNTTRHRLCRGGNRQLNAALHRIAITQIRLGGIGRNYFDHRLDVGDSKTEAIRALRRRLSDGVYRRMRIDAARARTAVVDEAA